MMALGDVLKKHRGAVGRDLAVAGHTWADVGSARLPIGQFISFVIHSPPGTAVYHETHMGWGVSEHMLADAVDDLNMLLWVKSADAQKKNPKFKPTPVQRPRLPGKPPPKQAAPPPERHVMTVEEYAKKAGLKMNFGEGAV